MEDIQIDDDNGYYCIMMVPFDDKALNEIEVDGVESQIELDQEWERDQWLDAWMDTLEPIHKYEGDND